MCATGVARERTCVLCGTHYGRHKAKGKLRALRPTILDMGLDALGLALFFSTFSSASEEHFRAPHGIAFEVDDDTQACLKCYNVVVHDEHWSARRLSKVTCRNEIETQVKESLEAGKSLVFGTIIDQFGLVSHSARNVRTSLETRFKQWALFYLPESRRSESGSAREWLVIPKAHFPGLAYRNGNDTLLFAFWEAQLQAALAPKTPLPKVSASPSNASAAPVDVGQWLRTSALAAPHKAVVEGLRDGKDADLVAQVQGLIDGACSADLLEAFLTACPPPAPRKRTTLTLKQLSKADWAFILKATNTEAPPAVRLTPWFRVPKDVKVAMKACFEAFKATPQKVVLLDMINQRLAANAEVQRRHHLLRLQHIILSIQHAVTGKWNSYHELLTDFLAGAGVRPSALRKLAKLGICAAPDTVERHAMKRATKQGLPTFQPDSSKIVQGVIALDNLDFSKAATFANRGDNIYDEAHYVTGQLSRMISSAADKDVSAVPDTVSSPSSCAPCALPFCSFRCSLCAPIIRSTHDACTARHGRRYCTTDGASLNHPAGNGSGPCVCDCCWRAGLDDARCSRDI